MPFLLLGGLGGLLGGVAYGYGAQVIRNLNQGVCFWDALSFNIDAGQVVDDLEGFLAGEDGGEAFVTFGGGKDDGFDFFVEDLAVRGKGGR
ncbi:hypothetical protein [Anaerolinea sp.]|uniref:hypothetical protein n=1 Tax=Anaerolinea sp. TaxID=1872519 RepID=UPI002ACE817E|nr:hypothetical protein [Anaerolinea sp.]